MQPYSQETLGSFLVRWAWARGAACSLVSSTGPGLLRLDQGSGPQLVRGDVASHCSGQWLQAGAGSLYDLLQSAGCSSSTCAPQRLSALAAAFRIYHRRRLRFGQLFCPACLREDMPRHLHMHWRLASSWICLRHGVSLMDACPHCGAPFAPYRNDSLVLGRCECCAFALYSAHPSTCSARQQAQQERVDALWRQAFRAPAAFGVGLSVDHSEGEKGS